MSSIIKDINREGISLRDCNIEIYYQPILDNNSKLLHKYESLMRLRYGKEAIEPAFFLEHSKETGCYHKLSQELLVAIFNELRRYKKLNVAINISMLNIVNINYCSLLFAELDTIQDPTRVTLEFSELDKMDFKRSLRFFEEIKKRGVKISLDDFGSGYANYEYLLNKDFDYLKIDGSIIKNICNNKKNEVIVESILNYSKQFKVPVIAEHVETVEIYNRVCEMGIEYSQGYYIGRPSPNLMVELKR